MASSQCCWSPRTHTENLGRGVDLSLRLPGLGETYVSGVLLPPVEQAGQGGSGNLTQSVQCHEQPSPASRARPAGSAEASPRLPSCFTTQGGGPSSQARPGHVWTPLAQQQPARAGPRLMGGRVGCKRCQPDGARETLVLLGIVVLEADLQLHRLQEPREGKDRRGERRPADARPSARHLRPPAALPAAPPSSVPAACPPYLRRLRWFPCRTSRTASYRVSRETLLL